MSYSIELFFFDVGLYKDPSPSIRRHGLYGASICLAEKKRKWKKYMEMGPT